MATMATTAQKIQMLLTMSIRLNMEQSRASENWLTVLLLFVVVICEHLLKEQPNFHFVIFDMTCNLQRAFTGH